MNRIPPELKYTASHQWLRLESDGLITVGLTDCGQQNLDAVVFVGLPDTGLVLKEGETACVIESVIGSADMAAPLAGEVAASNTDLPSAPETVNADPYGSGWLFKIKPADTADYEKLLDAQQYAAIA